MIHKHLRDEFQAIPEVNKQLKWLSGKIWAGEINRLDALMMAWDDGARTAVGPTITVVSTFNGQIRQVREMPESHRQAYTDGYHDGVDPDQTMVIQWPDESDELTDRQYAEVHRLVTAGTITKPGE